MEELRLFLENECFTLCPVPNQFTIFDLQDFSFLEESRKKQENIDVFATNGDGEQIIFSPIPIDYINPFANREIKSRSGSESTTKRPELLDDGFKKSTSIECEEIVEQVPNLCNTALNLLRFFGRYLRMTSLLPSIAKYSIPALTELFEYFFYAISLFFGSDGREIMEPLDKIQAILADIHDRIIFDETQSPRKVAGEA
ncbi:hypothetical protein DICVIV_06575 [Dictyocaulus viviparus]|uniref:Uncharacterized protein n=1 Tax=Dictyocaulus viviparus TaxID=29172 RepID=A0A0D8XY95_DICVI|nr:hypothetical protein DICVIV_06575 [Dictyocaulus viviparus]